MENEKFAEIIDKGECMSTLHQYPTFPWPEPFLKSVACKEEWAKHNFYPSNGLIGEVAYNLESQVYILKVNNTFYVPMSRKGIQFISETEYSKKKASQNFYGMDDRQKTINNDWDKFTKNEFSVIEEVTLSLLRDFNLHNYNQQWITQNTPLPIKDNRYNHLREDAPHYCTSSMGVMFKFYKANENGFKDMIDKMVNELSQNDNLSTKNISQLVDWVVSQTLDAISNEKSEILDLGNVSWFMGIASYVACIVNTPYKAQYEKIFLTAWNKYFTNETLNPNLNKLDKKELDEIVNSMWDFKTYNCNLFFNPYTNNWEKANSIVTANDEFIELQDENATHTFTVSYESERTIDEITSAGEHVMGKGCDLFLLGGDDSQIFGFKTFFDISNPHRTFFDFIIPGKKTMKLISE